MAPTFFYHSFPRPRTSESSRELVERGWRILCAIRRTGLILAPEIVEWTAPVSIGSSTPIRLLQQRICFTELQRHELPAHSEQFGPYAIEFDVTALRRAGALPVIYMPQALSEHDHLALLGPITVSHLGHIEHTLRSLDNLHQHTDLEYLQRQYPNATRIDDECVFNLTNGDARRGIVQEFQIPFGSIRDILAYLEFENAPFQAMIGVLSIVQSLFYPTDDEHVDQPLTYYRQREWRITANYSVNGTPRGQPLSEEQKEDLLHIDGVFWNRTLSIEEQECRRADKALSLALPAIQQLLSMITRIVVPTELVEQTRGLYSGVLVEDQ